MSTAKRLDARSRAPSSLRRSAASSLDSRPGSISPAQVRALHAVMRGRRLDPDEVKAMLGVASTKELSKARASEVIEQLGGGGLPTPPGGASPPRHRRKPGITRMITDDQVQQIERMLAEYFGCPIPSGGGGLTDVGSAWLAKNFKVDTVRGLASASRAGQVIRVLREMLERRA